jgi:hypothetical protein
MNPERLQMKGLLADLKKKAVKLDADAAGRLILIRTLANPYAEDVTDLDVEKLLNEASELCRIVTELREVRAKIKKLESDLD